MPSDYKAITDYNVDQLGRSTASRKTQICMYSDSTHFIYEILQNADDYGATEVSFILSKDRLTIEHDGEPFIDKNVESITYFGKSTSREDLVKTGRFGVGFKSVFAFTATPTIISGEEHFQIHDLYRVREHPYPNGFSRSNTRITLPFNHESERPDYVDTLTSPKEAYEKIVSRLTKLNMNTLLFTQHIHKISWKTDDLSGHYSREDNVRNGVRRTTISDGEQSKDYLVFSRITQWEGEECKAVEIAFAIDEERQLSQVDDCLYVLFATTQETHLKFILNGPYRTNPSRETILIDDLFNMYLMKETCELMKDTLLEVKSLGLLAMSFLSVLPNDRDKLPEFYEPLLDTTVKLFREQELVPTDDDGYAFAGDVRQGKLKLREVVTSKELQFFVERENACWAKGVEQNSRADNFLKCLGIEPWGREQLKDVLVDKFGGQYAVTSDKDDVWLRERDDVWLQRFYLLLYDNISSDNNLRCNLNKCRIIRVLEDNEENHIEGSKAKFPKRDEFKDLPQVKREILQGKDQRKIRDSLELLGVSEISDEDEISLILKEFYSNESDKLSTEQHLQHIRIFIKWWKKEGNANVFKHKCIFRSVGNDKFSQPKDCYIDSPLKRSGLKAIYSKTIPGIHDKVRLRDRYGELVKKGFCKFAIACGVEDCLHIDCQPCNYHPLWTTMDMKFPKTRSTHTKTSKDYNIPDLAKLLKVEDPAINLLVWDTLSKADKQMFKAVYRPNRQKPEHIEKSSLILTLMNAEWIPDKEGGFYQPRILTKETLHPNFKYDNSNGWLDEIGFGEQAKKQSEEYRQQDQQAKDVGFESADEMHTMKELCSLLKEKGISLGDAIAQLQPETSDFPVRNSANSERRQDRLAEQMKDAPDKKYEKIVRSVRISQATQHTRAWLEEQYTVTNQMICQICMKASFKKRNGHHYFEAVEALSKDHFPKEQEAQWLALCPLCAAKYKEFIKRDDGAMESLKKRLMDSKRLMDLEGWMIPLSLGESDMKLRFVETHLLDIKTILKNTRP